MDGKLETGSDVPAEDRTRLNTRRVELGLEPFSWCLCWLSSLDKISENFVRRADGRFKNSNKEK